MHAAVQSIPQRTSMHQVDTAFLRRLRARDQRAWFELWEAFGPVVRGTLYRWGNGRRGEETPDEVTGSPVRDS